MLSTKSSLFFLALLCCSLSIKAQSTDNFDLDEVYAINANGTISLNSDDADVTIVGSNRSDVSVEIHYKLDVTGLASVPEIGLIWKYGRTTAIW